MWRGARGGRARHGSHLGLAARPSRRFALVVPLEGAVPVEEEAVGVDVFPGDAHGVRNWVDHLVEPARDQVAALARRGELGLP